MKTQRNHAISRAAAAVVSGVLLTCLTACGDSEEDAPADTASSGQTEQAASDESADKPKETGPVTAENIADRCDELAAIVTTLRTEAPQEVKDSPAKNVTGNGFKYRSGHCTYAYEGDDFSDKNRVDIYADTAAGDAAGMKAHWDEIASTENLDGIGDAATFYTMPGVDAKASARALVDGETIISVRVTVPKTMEGSVFLSKAALASALEAVVG